MGTVLSETTSLLHSKEGDSIKVYPTRWLALTIYALHEMASNMMWITFSPITSIATCYYGVTLFWINSLSWINMLVYVVFLLPAIWFLEKFGLRVTAIVGGTLNAAGAWLRFAGSGPTSFWLLMSGQFLTSVTYLLETNACSMLSAVWFPPHERAIATTIFAIISAETGVLIGLLASPLVIAGGDNTDIVCNMTSYDMLSPERQDWLTTTNKQFFYYLLSQALLTTIILPVTYLIPDHPPTPPSVSATTKQDESIRGKLSLLQSFITAFKNKYFVAFIFVYAMFVASAGSYVTVFQEVLHHSGYAHYQGLIGYLGASMKVASIIGLIAASKWIDYTKRFYVSSVFICWIGTIVAVLLSVSIQLHLQFYIVFIAVTLTSGSFSLLGAVGIEYAVEMTFPLSEGISASLLNVVTMSFAIVMVVVVGLLVQNGLAIYGTYVFGGVLLLASIIMIFIRPQLRRVNIEHQTDTIVTQKHDNKQNVQYH